MNYKRTISIAFAALIILIIVLATATGCQSSERTEHTFKQIEIEITGGEMNIDDTMILSNNILETKGKVSGSQTIVIDDDASKQIDAIIRDYSIDESWNDFANEAPSSDKIMNYAYKIELSDGSVIKLDYSDESNLPDPVKGALEAIRGVLETQSGVPREN